MMNKQQHGSIRRVLCLTFCTFLCLSLIAGGASAMRNPSAVYCEAMGYEYATVIGEGGEIGICTLPDNTTVDAWDFLLGEEAVEYSFCAQQGYLQKIVYNDDSCRIFGLDHCAVCILDEGEELEVTALMDLDFSESECGDGICGVGEDHATCPKDCVYSVENPLCCSPKTGICDEECLAGIETGPDETLPQPEATQQASLPVLCVVLALGIAAILVMRK